MAIYSKTNVKEKVLIRLLQPSDSISHLTELLHRAYANMADMGLCYLASHQDDTTTRERLLRGFPWVAEIEATLVGTVTLYPPDPTSQCLLYRQPGVYSFGQFGVHPEFQKYGVGKRLFQRIEEQAHQLGAHQLALDTAEGAVHLRQWYESLGFCFVEYVSWDDTNYRSVVLSKHLGIS